MDGTRIILLIIGCLLFMIFFIIIGYLERKEERERIHKEIMERNYFDHLGLSDDIIINKEYPKDIHFYQCDFCGKASTDYNTLRMHEVECCKKIYPSLYPTYDKYLKSIGVDTKDYISKDVIREKLGDIDVQYAYIKEHGLDEEEITTAKAQYYAMKELLEKFLDM